MMTVHQRRIRFAQPLGQYENPEVPAPLITEGQQIRSIRGLGMIPFLKIGNLPPGAVIAAGVATTGLSGLGAWASFRAIYRDRSAFWQVIYGTLGVLLTLNIVGGVLLTASGIALTKEPMAEITPETIGP